MNPPAPGSARNIRGHIVFAFALALAIYMMWLLRSLLALVYVSALFAVILTPVVHATSRLHIGRWFPFQRAGSIFFLLLLVAGALTGFGFLAFPPVIRDLQTVQGELPNRIPALLVHLREIPFIDRLHSVEVIGWLQGSLSHAAGTLLLSLTDWAGAIAQVAVGFVLTLYFIIEGEAAYRWFLSFLPPAPRKRLNVTLRRAAGRMEKWLLGQASLMLILGAVSMIVYLSLGVRYAYGLGVVTGLLNIVPVLGVTISIVLAVLVAAIDSWGRVLGVAIFFAIWVQIESSWLVPRIMKNRVDLPALGIFVALIVGADLGGIPGAMVAIPTAALVAVLLDEYFVRQDRA
ncbi:MAG: AI-2E family transporter [Terracidiphilus sp.]